MSGIRTGNRRARKRWWFHKGDTMGLLSKAEAEALRRGLWAQFTTKNGGDHADC